MKRRPPSESSRLSLKNRKKEREITDVMRAAAAAFGRIGGLKGGPARAKKLSATTGQDREERRDGSLEAL